MYATADDFVQEYGFDEAWQLLRDESELLTADLLRQALDGVFDPDTTPEEQAAALTAAKRLRDVIIRAERFMDGYLRSAVMLPLETDQVEQTPLTTCCLELSRCQLMDDPDNQTDAQKERCKEWKDWLKDVARGTVKLLEPPASSSGRVRSGHLPSAYNWGAFGK